MTENSPTNVYQNCQESKDCDFAIDGQICSEEYNCIFECEIDSDCELGGKCLSHICDWSGEPVPPPSTNTTHNLIVAAAEDSPSASGKASADDGILKVGSPLVVAIIVITTLVAVCGIAAGLFFFCRHKRLAHSSRGLKPFVLSPGASRSSSSLKKSKKDHREKESRGSKKSYEFEMYVEDEGKEEETFGESHTYSKDAVGSGAVSNAPRLPQRSQTMYGSSTPSTVELNVDYPVLFQQQHHFMSSEGYPEDNNNNYQQHHHFMSEPKDDKDDNNNYQQQR